MTITNAEDFSCELKLLNDAFESYFSMTRRDELASRADRRALRKYHKAKSEGKPYCITSYYVSCHDSAMNRKKY